MEDSRKLLYDNFKNMIRKVGRAAKVSGAGTGFYNNVMEIIRKIVGQRVSKAKATPADPAGTSASQQSYDNIANHLQALIQILTAEPKYTPNEAELTVATLTTTQANMVAANTAVAQARINLSNTLNARNTALYDAAAGVVATAQSAKDYVRSVFGFKSPEFKMVSKIKFKVVKNG